MEQVAPLKASFMVTSMVGFLISVVYISKFSVTWAFTFALVFILMFVASMISMVRASPDEQLYARPKSKNHEGSF